MKINMAESTFEIGMILGCTTCHGQKLQGEVMAFDYPTKMLALKTAAANGKPGLHDVRILNVSFMSDINVIQEATEPPQSLSNLNTAKITARARQNVEEKQRQVNYVGVGVTPQAQSLFLHITKTINEVRWDGQNIVVMDQVTICPPYSLDNCKSRDNSTKATSALSHVKKIVEKYYRDQEKDSSERGSRESSSSSS